MSNQMSATTSKHAGGSNRTEYRPMHRGNKTSGRDGLTSVQMTGSATALGGFDGFASFLWEGQSTPNVIINRKLWDLREETINKMNHMSKAELAEMLQKGTEPLTKEMNEVISEESHKFRHHELNDLWDRFHSLVRDLMQEVERRLGKGNWIRDFTEMAEIRVQGELNIFSNFYKSSLFAHGIIFSSGEQLYQMYKAKEAGNPTVARMMLQMGSAGKIKGTSKQVNMSSDAWLNNCCKLASQILQLKTEQTPGFRELLLSTGSKPILHTVGGWEGFWGSLNGGKNMFGKVLEDQRRKIQDQDVPHPMKRRTDTEDKQQHKKQCTNGHQSKDQAADKWVECSSCKNWERVSGKYGRMTAEEWANRDYTCTGCWREEQEEKLKKMTETQDGIITRLQKENEQLKECLQRMSMEKPQQGGENTNQPQNQMIRQQVPPKRSTGEYSQYVEGKPGWLVQKEYRFLCLGDSMLRHPGIEEGLQAMTEKNTEIRAKGIGGARIPKIRQQMDSELQEFGRCDGLIIHAGVNHLLKYEFIPKAAEEEIEKEVRDTMSRVADNYGEEMMKIWCGMIPADKKGREWNRRLMQVNEMLKTICQENQWGYVHPHGFLSNGMTKRENYTDGLHLAAPGRKLHACNITNVLQCMQKQGN